MTTNAETMTPTLTEQSRRRPEFAEGVPVELANGETWQFPRPQVRIRPRFEGGKVVDVAGSYIFGGDHDARMAAFHAARDGSEQAGALFEMVASLLARNYDLSDADLSDLFTFVAGSEAGERMRVEIMEVALGISKKLLPATGS